MQTMAKGKVTLRDIADACGVSTATVSYVLNHSEKEKISHKTRLKIVKVAAELHYTPSLFTKKPAKQKSNLVGIIINLNENGNSAGKKMMYYDLAAELSSQIRSIGFETLTITTANLLKDAKVITSHCLDAVFMIDVDGGTARKITHDYYVPIIFLNCEINDPLFCKIYPNYQAVFRKAREILQTDTPFLLMEDICNCELRCRITASFQTKDIFIHTPGANLQAFLEAHRGSKGIVLGDLLGLQALYLFGKENLAVLSSLEDSPLPKGANILRIRNIRRAEAAAEVLKNMLYLDYIPNEGNRIFLDCEP